MRTIETHKINGCNEQIVVTAMDDAPLPGGAHHSYRICVPILNPAEHHVVENSKRMRTYCDINFQKGPIKEAGVNGITNEALLAVVIDRLQCFQKGPFACRENALALTKIEEAMHWLKHRTEQRLARGVEGTHGI